MECCVFVPFWLGAVFSLFASINLGLFRVFFGAFLEIFIELFIDVLGMIC